MAFAKISQFLFSLNIFKASSWHDFLAGLSGFIGRILYRLLICALGKVADVCQLIFKKLAGISPNGVRFQGLNTSNGSDIVTGDIVQYIVQSDAVRNILWAMLILAVVILIIAVFVANIKTEFAKDGNNNKRKVIKLAFRGLANFVLVPVICLFGLFIGNAVLRAIDGATNPTGSQTTLSAQIFLAGGYNANRTRQSETKGAGSDSITYYENSFGEKLKSNGANFGVFIDDSSGAIRRTAADKIDMFFANGYRILVGTSEVWNAIGKVTDFNSDNGDHVYSYMANAVNLKELGVWHDGAFGDDIDIKLTTEEGWYGVKVDKDGKIGITLHADNAQYVVFSIYDVGLVYTYYDLRIGSFDYLISTICLIFCAYTLLIAALGLVKRMFYLSILFIISPGVCAIYPIDEGKAMERWRTEFIKYVLSAYSVVIVLNLFLALLPTLLRIELFTNWSTDLAWLPIDCELANYLARLLIVIGGLTFFKDATKQLAGIIGAADANDEGASRAKDFAKNVGRVKAGVGVGWSIAKAPVKAGIGIGKWISAKKDNKFANEMADAQARADASQEAEGGKAENPSAVPGNNSNSMNMQTSGGQSGTTNTANISSPSAESTSTKASSNAGTSSGAGNGMNNFVVKTGKNGDVDYHKSRLETTKLRNYHKKIANRDKDREKYINDQRAKTIKKGGYLGDNFNERMGAEFDKKWKRNEKLKKIGKGILKGAGKTIKNGYIGVNKAIGVGKKVVSNVTDPIRGIAAGDYKWKDAQDMFKGSREYQKKNKEKAQQKEDAKMKKDIADINKKLSEQEKEIEKQQKEIEHVDKQIDAEIKKNKKQD
ncbi:MAG TPA: hypothetical protein DCO89_03560 [Clostridiales bacterium]|nr:hypothetical protein [Clostridiales bacterium]